MTRFQNGRSGPTDKELVDNRLVLSSHSVGSYTVTDIADRSDVSTNELVLAIRRRKEVPHGCTFEKVTNYNG